MAARAGDFAGAKTLFAESVRAFEEADYRLGMAIALNNGATTMRLRSSDLAGGEVGGLLEFRDHTLNEAHNALGRFARRERPRGVVAA